jgi:hypothetical protein
MDTDTPTPPTDQPTTGPQYRAEHGAEDWSPAEIEAQQNLAAIHQLAA